jgi:chromosome segregation ATPase
MQSLRQDHAQALLAWDQEKNAFIQQLAQLQAELQNTQATLHWTEDQLQNHRHSLEEVLNSTSWKMTKHVRALGIK